MSNSAKSILEFLEENPFSTEIQIEENLWGHFRKESCFSNKKYCDMLRRLLYKYEIQRVEASVKGNASKYYYFIPNYINN